MAQKRKNSSTLSKKNKAALYIRVSTIYQIDKDSLKVQEEDRPDYQKMMGKLRKGEFSHLVVWKIDRISRNLLDFAEMYQELKDLGVTFISKNEQFDLLRHRRGYAKNYSGLCRAGASDDIGARHSSYDLPGGERFLERR